MTETNQAEDEAEIDADLFDDEWGEDLSEGEEDIY